MRTRVITSEEGSALIEVVAFAAIAFGLVLGLGCRVMLQG